MVLSQGMNEVTSTSEDLTRIADQLQESLTQFKLSA
jgi:methyl-accepting chemotaxis protein